MRAVDHLTLPRALHPGAWWLWALGMAVAASRTRNPVLLVLILAVTGFVVAARRTDAPWAHSYAAFLKLGLVVIGVRVVLQALLSTRSQGNTVLFTLPLIPLPDWANGVKLGGEVTAGGPAHRAVRRAAARRRCCAASVRPTHWPARGGCSSRCPGPSTRSAWPAWWR